MQLHQKQRGSCIVSVVTLGMEFLLCGCIDLLLNRYKVMMKYGEILSHCPLPCSELRATFSWADENKNEDQVGLSCCKLCCYLLDLALRFGWGD